MSKPLPVPPDLEHLIEKRERETDRRKPSGGGRPSGTPERRRKPDRRRKRQPKPDP